MKGNSTGGMLIHNSVISGFIYLDISLEFDLEVLVKIVGLSCNNSARSEGAGKSV